MTTLRRMGHADRVDAVFAVLLGILAVADVTTDGRGAQSTVALVLAAAVVTLPLAWRRTRPVLAGAGVAVGLVSVYTVPDPPDAVWQLLAIIIAAYSLAAYAPGRSALLGAVLLTTAIVISISVDPSDELANVPPTLVIFVAIPFGAGRALRGRTADASAAQARAAEAVGAERARIARELHDVVAHSITVIAVQADAAEAALARDPARALEPLSVIKHTARDALAEMRHLLTLLRTDGTPVDPLVPQPGLAGLPELAVQLRRSGLEVELRGTGPHAVPPGVDLAAFRIVQEALTNVVKHAGAGRAVVEVRDDPGELRLEVRDDGDGPAGRAGAGGHGLVGMRERVALYGGRLEAGPAVPGPGFRVTATFPLTP